MTLTAEELQQLNKDVVEHFQNENYSEAIKIGVQAVNFGKQKLGLKHPNTATAISNLALLYDRVGDHDRAEPLHQWKQQQWENNSWETQAV